MDYSNPVSDPSKKGEVRHHSEKALAYNGISEVEGSNP